MTQRNDIRTALLAAVFGAALLNTGGTGEKAKALDGRTARELAVISRVLEKRLGETRRSLGSVLSPPAGQDPAGTGDLP